MCGGGVAFSFWGSPQGLQSTAETMEVRGVDSAILSTLEIQDLLIQQSKVEEFSLRKLIHHKARNILSLTIGPERRSTAKLFLHPELLPKNMDIHVGCQPASSRPVKR
jgi:hypothetical protein